jgi:cytochrome c2
MSRHLLALSAAVATMVVAGTALAQDIKRGEKLFEECRANQNRVGHAIEVGARFHSSISGPKFGISQGFNPVPAQAALF